MRRSRPAECSLGKEGGEEAGDRTESKREREQQHSTVHVGDFLAKAAEWVAQALLDG